MKKLILAGLVAACAVTPALTTPVWAALKPGGAAPDFTAKGSLGGKDFNFNLKDALKKGPVVVYFYPSAYTGGCDAEAHAFAENADKFAAAGAQIIGVSADSLDRLKVFSADPDFCAGKFPIASDAETTIAASYNLKVTPGRPGAKDVKGNEIGHGFIERVTFIVGKDGKILSTLSQADDKLSPVDLVDHSLAFVQGLKK
jgi:thioredoxin-dependent peroxiredoxin